MRGTKLGSDGGRGRTEERNENIARARERGRRARERGRGAREHVHVSLRESNLERASGR